MTPAGTSARLKNFPRWGFVSGRLGVLEERFAGREFFMSLIMQENMGDIVPHLQETFLREYLAPGTVWEDFSALADRCFHETALSLRAECPESAAVDIFLIPFDYLNLKNALLREAVFPFPQGLFQEEPLQAVARGEYGDLPETLRNGEGWSVTDMSQVDPVDLDIILDGAYLRHLLMLAGESGSELIASYVYERVQAYIVTIFWRAVVQDLPLRRFQSHLLPMGDFAGLINDLSGQAGPEAWPAMVGGAVGDALAEALEMEPGDRIAGFSLRAANRLMGVAREGRLQTAGPERVFSFLAGLSTEIVNLKLVVAGRLSRIDRSLLKQRLREGYV
ncbi:MAG TPA: V-type ATPase subunit [Deltaproteobacteria bacterium]|nr:V-type ATPase subunit [Deltaproteobacteria bacterium]HPR56276.1 V-type ATPase subunit [Deltaproteobacteria bacterium]HXK46490.1 V-type ATPase subunit [Deltaproteobacteria bacterium]